ncbi:hypothetical protein A45J_2159 [hot springs metagenome]|uniref:Uncharacterized protein n=1 Tax=hot springs metagenome TaxID=433727 RepID=A0A5J4KXR8_9ZZZZ
MEISTMIKTLQDSMGIPFYPILFQVLMVITFALHIIFVNFVIGTLSLSLYGYIKGTSYWKSLSNTMIRATTASTSMAILLGVAPLLFVQVIYDPFWYVSNTVSAAWVMGFILAMMTAYGFTYVFYLKRGADGKGLIVLGVAAFILFLLSGVIMHVLGYQLLLPEKWYEWYIKGNNIDTTGMLLHAFQASRFLHFIVPSFAMTGILLMLYAWYFKNRSDKDRDYIDWVGKTGAKMAFIFTAIQAGIGFWWLFSLPIEFKFFTNPLFLIGVAFGIMLLILLYNAQKDPIKYAVYSMFGAFLTILSMAYTREALRMKYLVRFNYSIFDYKVNVDYGSTALFLLTFIAGLSVVGYLLAIAYKSGKTTDEYVSTPSMEKWGKISIAVLLAWIAVVVGIGVMVSIKNYL